MSNNQQNFSLADILELRRSKERPRRKPARNLNTRETKDPETLAVLSQHQEKLTNLVIFPKNKELPPCPKCRSMLTFQRELRDQARLVCTPGGHSTEVIRITASHIWVRADFFEGDFE